LKSAQLRDLTALMQSRYWRARATVPMNTSYAANELICAVHIRRDDIAPAKFVEIDYYASLFAELAPIVEKVGGKFYISTDGTEDDIKAITDKYPCIVNHGGDPRQAFHDLACADVLVPTVSSFSVIAGRVSTNLKLFHGEHQFKDLSRFLKRGLQFTPDWIYIGDEGRLSDESKSCIVSHFERRRNLKAGVEFLAAADWPDQGLA